MSVNQPKQARRSLGEPYSCRMEWPEDCFVQCGGSGVVFESGYLSAALSGDHEKAANTVSVLLGGPLPPKSYRTAFFEAFPSSPKCFIRGEGASIEEAESKAWGKWQRIQDCDGHDFDRRGREDGYAYCLKCPYSGMVLPPTTHCSSCGKPAHYGEDAFGGWYCEKDYYALEYDRFIAPKEKGVFCSPSYMRAEFILVRTRNAYLEAVGINIGSEEAKTLTDAIIKAEVWTGMSPRNFVRYGDGTETPHSDEEIESSYKAAFGGLIEWLKTKNLHAELGASFAILCRSHENNQKS